MANKKKPITEKAQEALARTLKKFEDGDLSEVIRAVTFKIPESWPAFRWSIRNQILAYSQTGTLNCRTYKQWQDVGRKVTQRGASYIWAPCVAHGKRKVKRDNGTEEEVYSYVYKYRAIPVFPVDMTEGDPLPDEDLAPRELPPLFHVAEALGVSAEYVPTPPDRYGDFFPSERRINLGTDDTRTFFHELAHAAHEKISGRGLYFENPEVVAEFTAAVLSIMYGWDITGTTWSYIKMFAHDPLEAVRDSLDIIQEVVNLIVSLGEEEPAYSA